MGLRCNLKINLKNRILKIVIENLKMADSNKWEDFRQRARSFDKIALESSNFYLPHYFKFTNFNDSEKVYFLGVLNGQTHFTLLYSDFPGGDGAQKRFIT